MKLLPHSAAVALVLLTGLTGCESEPAPGDQAALGEYVYVNNCQPCHAPEGDGNPANGAPGISGMPDWYVLEQLHKFRDGRRGAHFDDVAGLRMRPMARTMEDDAEFEAVAAYVAAMPRKRKAKVELAGGDLEAGKKAFATCAACHGPEGHGNKQLNAPPIAGADAWYIQTQLHNFKVGIRGAAEGDVYGAQMRPNVMSLDDQALLDLASYVSSLTPPN